MTFIALRKLLLEWHCMHSAVVVNNNNTLPHTIFSCTLHTYINAISNRWSQYYATTVITHLLLYTVHHYANIPPVISTVISAS